MSRINYEIWLSTSKGDRLELLDSFISLKYVRAVNAVGSFSVTLPDTINRNLIQPDQMIEIWRGVDGQLAQFEMLGLVRSYTIQERGGSTTVTLSGFDGNALLADHIVAYAANSTHAKINNNADNAMKGAVAENMGSTVTDTERDLSLYGFTVAPNVSLGPTIEKRYAWDNLLAVLNKFADMAYEEGIATYFDMVPRIVSNSQLAWQFETYINQPGADRTYTSNNPLIFSSEWGTLVDPLLRMDYSDQKSVCYVGGQGEEENRRVVERQASSRINASPWARREFFYNASNQTNTTAALTKIGGQQLRKTNRRLLFTARLQPTDTARYGVEWHLGDMATASFDNRQFNGLISPVGITVDRNGEKIDARFEVTT